MHAPSPVEAALARLMPPALSQGGLFEIEAMLDDLAETAPKNAAAPAGWLTGWRISVGSAAALAALCAVFPALHHSSEPQVAANRLDQSSSGLVLVSESGRVESMTDEGWQEDLDGSAMHALRLNWVEENNLRDKETGMIVRVSEPREEVLLMPVSAF